MDSSWCFIPADQSAADRSNYKTAISNEGTSDNRDDAICTDATKDCRGLSPMWSKGDLEHIQDTSCDG